jgi:heme exporter protein B
LAAKLWWLIQKDLWSECRARRVWPTAVVFGIAVVLVLAMPMDLLPEQRRQMGGSLLWLAIFFAGTLVMDWSFASEREDGCWESLLLYPVSPATIYLAKLVVNVVCMAALECVLIPLFVVLSDVPLLSRPGAMLLVALLGNLGIGAVGTLLSALGTGIGKRNHLSVLLVLPLAIPVVLAAAEATRLLGEDGGQLSYWRWIQLLAGFAVIFVTAGTLLIQYVVEE